MAELKPKAPKKRNPKPNCKSGVVKEDFRWKCKPKEDSFMYKIVNLMHIKIAEDIKKQQEWEERMYSKHLEEMQDFKDGKPVYFTGFFNLIKD